MRSYTGQTPNFSPSTIPFVSSANLVAVAEVRVFDVGLIVPGFKESLIACCSHSSFVLNELLGFLLVHVDKVGPELERKSVSDLGNFEGGNSQNTYDGDQ